MHTIEANVSAKILSIDGTDSVSCKFKSEKCCDAIQSKFTFTINFQSGLALWDLALKAQNFQQRLHFGT